jgi:argininosuccinate lyase
VLEDLPLDVYLAQSELFDKDVYEAISLRSCVETRISEGGTSLASVMAQISYVKDALK